MAVQWVPLEWAAASLVKSAIALPAGMVTDRFGRLPVLLGGWGLRVGSLLALAFLRPPSIGVWLLFLAHCAAIAVTEPRSPAAALTALAALAMLLALPPRSGSRGVA